MLDDAAELELAAPVVVEPAVDEAVVDEALVAELVAFEIGNALPPMVIFVAGALPKFSVTDVALAFSLTVRTLSAVTVP